MKKLVTSVNILPTPYIHLLPISKMSDLLNSYTFEAKKIVYYSVTVGAENKTEAKRIASDFEHCKHYERLSM